MNLITAPETVLQPSASSAASNSADAWQRRFGVPWERVERAVRAVSDRAVAASRRRFADLNEAGSASEAHSS